jgi:hypothetical protein
MLIYWHGLLGAGLDGWPYEVTNITNNQDTAWVGGQYYA